MKRIFLLLLCVLAGCSQPESLRIGFVGGLTGRFADLGEAGRNGVQLAVEERNQAGGVNGRQIELLIRDDMQDAVQAEKITREFLSLKVEAIIGPMTSAMTDAVLVPATEAGIVVISPTVTARQYYRRDDQIFLIMPSTTELARFTAEYQFKQKNVRRVFVLYDQRNRSYTESWLTDFSAAMKVLGGSVQARAFDSGQNPDQVKLAEDVVKEKPDALLILASAVDTARLAQHVRVYDSKLPMLASMWSATERLIELGGQAVEGVTLNLTFDRSSRAPAYLEFQRRYRERFRQEPGFAEVAGYDAAVVAFEAIERRAKGQTLKDSLLKNGPFSGAQGKFAFDAYGDTQRQPRMLQVQGGQFVNVE